MSGEVRESPYLQMIRRKLKKSLPEEGEATEAQQLMERTSCLLFIYFTTAETGAEAKARLERLLELLPRDETRRVPLVLLSSSSSAEADEELFGLEGLVEEGIIKRYDRFNSTPTFLL